MRKVVKQTVTLPAGRRILAVSDIHGHDSWFAALLEQVGYNAAEDVLFLVGDLLEKGSENLRVLRRVMDLCAHGAVYPSMGNVDVLSLMTLDDTETDGAELCEIVTYACRYWGGCLFAEMCAEQGIPLVLEPEPLLAARARLQRHYQPEIAFLHSLPTCIETQNFLFVHGGIPGGKLDALLGTDEHPLLKYDAFADAGLCFDQYVIVGHWPVVLYGEGIAQLNPVIHRAQRIISIDGGCGVKREGQLNALLIPERDSEDFSFASYDDLPRVYARDAQAASSDPVLIKWTDRAIDVLERGGEFARVRHRSSGAVLRVPDWMIEETAQGTVCGQDYTDYCLPVQPGDCLHLLATTSEGHYDKKDGVIGWYRGRISPEP